MPRRNGLTERSLSVSRLIVASVSGFGFVGPNSAALAMQRYPHAAGSAAAVLGSFQFGMAAVIAPLSGIGGTHDATPMISLILGLAVAAVACRFLLAGSARRQAAAAASE